MNCYFGLHKQNPKSQKAKIASFCTLFFLQYVNGSRFSKFNAKVKKLLHVVYVIYINIFIKKSFNICLLTYWKSAIHGILKIFENFEHFHLNVKILFYHNRDFIQKLKLLIVVNQKIIILEKNGPETPCLRNMLVYVDTLVSA